MGGRFAVLERLGAGSMGTVYRGRQEAMGRDVALKIVRSDRLADPQAKGRFQQEAHAAAALSVVFDRGTADRDFRAAVAFERAQRSFQQLFGDDGVEPAYDNTKLQATRIELCLNHSCHVRLTQSLFFSSGEL